MLTLHVGVVRFASCWMFVAAHTSFVSLVVLTW